jgi:beta-galactosidase
MLSQTGDCTITAHFTPAEVKDKKKALPEMPRFGMQMILTPGFEDIAWFGPGPQETYCDRKDLRVGIYSGRIDEQYFADYSEPGESGNKVDVRWARLTGKKVGLKIEGIPLVSVNALPYTTEDLESFKHTYQMPRRDTVTLNVDLMQRGVGGDDSWGALPHPEYRIEPKERSYTFRLTAFDPMKEK